MCIERRRLLLPKLSVAEVVVVRNREAMDCPYLELMHNEFNPSFRSTYACKTRMISCMNVPRAAACTLCLCSCILVARDVNCKSRLFTKS